MSPNSPPTSPTPDTPKPYGGPWPSADFGGNLTAIGASANVVVIGMAQRTGTPITFWEFTRKGAIVTLITIALAAPYLWLRYFVLG